MAIDWAGGRGPVAIFVPPHPMAFTAAECDALIGERVGGWKIEASRTGRRIEDAVLRARVVEPLTVANSLRWRHDAGVGEETMRQLLKYEVGGHMATHTDRMAASDQLRYYEGIPKSLVAPLSAVLRGHEDIATSLVAQVSDGSDYGGGDVEFDVDGEVIQLPRTRGTVAVFDSTVPHRVREVTAGTRYSVTVFGRPSPLPPVGDELIGYEPPSRPSRASLLTVCPVIVPPVDGLLDSWDHPNHLIVVNGDSDAWRERCQERGWAYRMDRYSRNLGCPASWNLAFHRARQIGASHVAILSQGTVLADGTKHLEQILAKRPQAPWIEVSGGVASPWHCRVIAVDVWERVDGFDPQLPIWADIDFQRRVWLTGDWDRWSQRAVRVQLPARDVRNSAARAGAVPLYVYDLDRHRYAAKWGGPHNAETFARPWDPTSASPDVATPAKVLAHGGFAAMMQTAQLVAGRR